MLFAIETAYANPSISDWSAEPPPQGWSNDAYSPKAIKPNFNDEYQPAYADGNYNSWEDPYHPLKNPNEDPGPDWDRQPGKNMPDNSPGVAVVIGIGAKSISSRNSKAP